MGKRIKHFGIFLSCLAVVWLILIHSIALPDRLSKPSSTTVYYQDGQVAHTFLAPDDRWRVAVSGSDVDPHYVEALVAIEDKRFWWHPGFDPFAICRAAIQNMIQGRIVSGASTLTMQLVRVLEPRDRTIFSKLIEAFRASQIEYFFTKEEILGFYLTFVPYGKNIEGVEAASLLYFGHRASHLDSREIATLIAVPQNPNRRYPSVDNADRLLWARNHVGRLLHQQHLLPLSESQDFSAVFSKPPPIRLLPFRREALHVAYWLRPEEGQKERVETTLDRDLQHQVEQLVSRHQNRLLKSDIHHISVVVVDNTTGEIRSLVGGFDFFDSHTGAQIPSFTIPRNCGSTLKPLLYAYAIDRGLLLPSTLVRDIPEQFGGYTPRNFRGRYDGLVSLESALIRSLNAPFIRLLADVGFGEFASVVLRAGGERLESRVQDYGLSMMLGAELTPLELAELYSTLGNKGNHRELRILSQPEEAPYQHNIVSEESIWITAQTLQRRDRPDFPARSAFATSKAISWKTGTSVGFRDAWSAGWYGDYTVVVWVGNLDYRSSLGLIGAEAAAPIFFDIIEALPKQNDHPQPDKVIDVEVCSFSGQLPHAFCDRRQTIGINDRIPTQRCLYHQYFEMDLQSRERVFPGCREERKTQMHRFLVLPSSVQRWMSGQAMDLPKIAPECNGIYVPDLEPGSLQILSPYSGQISMLLRGVPAEKQPISLWADYPDPSSDLKWFVNDELVAIAPAGEVAFWAPHEGRHLLRVEDNSGLKYTRVLEVVSP